MALTLDNTLGTKGVYFLEATTAHTSLVAKNIVALWINADAVFTTLTDEDDVNIITQCNLTSRTVGKGAIIGCLNGKKIKSVTISSGSAIGIRG
tara:strand:- start:2301 stop:2582 length:282 start_codon:yes stop_codon:yes gene_type:complete